MINDDGLEPPERPDFRRRGYGVPLVLVDGKFVAYKRASSAGKILDDESQLVDWGKRTVVIGAAQRPDLMAIVSTLDAYTDRKQIRDIAEDCLVAGKGTERRNTGTAIHAMLDHVDLNHDWQPAPQFRDAVQSYVDALEVYGLVPVDVEVRCVDDLRRIAGTMDRRYRTTRNLVAPDGTIIPIGSIVVADTKTGQSLEYAAGSYCTQLAAYADSVRYDVVTNERTPFDPPTYPDWGIIVHVVADEPRTDMYFVDLEAGRHGLELAGFVRHWRGRTDLIMPARQPLRTAVGGPIAPVVSIERDEPEIVVPIRKPIGPDEERARETHPSNGAPSAPVPAVDGSPAPIRPVSDADASTDVLAANGTDLGAVREWLRGRIATVRTNERATAWLQRKWPEGVAGLKFDTQTADELDAISEVLWECEKEYSLPFPTSDPRTPTAPGGNRVVFDAAYNGPRKALMRSWLEIVAFEQDEWLGEALEDFATFSEDWRDEDITEMLDGTLRAIGYDDGVLSLGEVTESEAATMRSAAWGLNEGTAYVLYSEDGKPVVRTVQPID